MVSSYLRNKSICQFVDYTNRIAGNFRGKTLERFSRNSSLLQACGIKFVGIHVNVRGTRLISENHEHLYPRNYPLYGIAHGSKAKKCPQ